ncbi:hypothetical protein JCM3765_006223 [Sporobolomyces pararoseus]
MVRFKHRYILSELIFESTVDQLPPLYTSSTSSSSSSSLKKENQTGPSTIPTHSQFTTPPQFSESSLVHLLRDSLQANFGDIVSGSVGGTFSVKYLSPQTCTLILRVSREHFQTLWSSLTLLRKIGGIPVIVKVNHVSGTIRKIQHRAIQQDREFILKSHRKKSVEYNLVKKKKKVQNTTGKGKLDANEEEKEFSSSEEAIESKLKESEEKIMAIEA